MSAGDADTVLLDRRGRVAVLTLNRPGAINAINNAIRGRLPALLRQLDEDAEVAAIILTGAGSRGFSVGADIKEARVPGSGVAERRRLMPATWIEALDRVAKPVIAAIHGFCLGGGLELALACDIRIAAAGAQFGLPETTLGLIPGGGGTQRLPRLIGLARALDLLITGGRIGTEEAYRMGLVTRIAATPDACVEEALRVAETIAARPPDAIAYVKEAARSGFEMELNDGLRLEKSLFALLAVTADRAEAAAAFREKRQPKFSGD